MQPFELRRDRRAARDRCRWRGCLTNNALPGKREQQRTYQKGKANGVLQHGAEV